MRELHPENLTPRAPAPLGSRILTKTGYWRIRVPGATSNERWKLEHRVVWEREHGPIPKGAVVHHLNGDRADNRIENLELLESHASHMREHHGQHLPEFNRRPFTPERLERMRAVGRQLVAQPGFKQRCSRAGKQGAAARWAGHVPADARKSSHPSS